MGKKSKNKSGKRKGGGKIFSGDSAKRNERDNDNAASVKAPASASCWLCLEEDSPDEPLIRDCSCRADSGWAHLNCLVSYYKHECDQGDKPFDVYLWQKCNCCKQKHANHILLRLSREAKSYLTEKYPGREEKTLAGLHMILDAVMLMQHAGNADKEIADEGMAAAKQIISIAGDRRPASQLAQMFLAAAEESKGTRDGLKLAISHWENVKICAGQDAYAQKTSDMKIAELKHELGGESKDNVHANAGKSMKSRAPNRFGQLDMLEEKYHDSVRKQGADSFDAIGDANVLGMNLFVNERGVEAQRLLNDNLCRSRRVLGPAHQFTLEAEKLLKQARQRLAGIIGEKLTGSYHVLEYNEDARAYTLKGPILDPRKEEEEDTRSVPMKDLLLLPGCPVICEGLKNASHLNGKLGSAKRYDHLTTRYQVNFEDETLKPVFVKKENLRVAFDLPPQEVR
mmetsp:Transcript_54272/g.115281  ORF Transcript_54272/g.115281 Transcript_54272/m.115281 type:complete len:455 (-) Transcript_54272:123-1487(-)|eukprot:CAMPEP_0172531384 /NCGR_PEP_ID=MMETSP1067-20121228/4823_1 /TAXON_ID=265564 ORGANISM="Thalassiosira punctigera, Strain Tpunct2005C2" /NCGR_SAMPLE_ID=MMETSP1067 /ASSEMBLY_ACC=CAM_ASM_000444 /LENGTH=454 /DNA_ID=CAMNT_0013315761 /DNA_START=99 /DNA_END=1463 /DNA_ORIENTATION=-